MRLPRISKSSELSTWVLLVNFRFSSEATFCERRERFIPNLQQKSDKAKTCDSLRKNPSRKSACEVKNVTSSFVFVFCVLYIRYIPFHAVITTFREFAPMREPEIMEVESGTNFPNSRALWSQCIGRLAIIVIAQFPSFFFTEKRCCKGWQYLTRTRHWFRASRFRYDLQSERIHIPTRYLAA